MKLNPLTLKFSGESSNFEEPFLKDYYRVSLIHIRVLMILGALLYASFGILDILVMPEKKFIMWSIRFIVVGPGLISVLLLSFSSIFEQYMQRILAFSYIMAGTGIICMIAIAPPLVSYSYYVGLLLVFIWGYTLIRLFFIWACVAGWVLVIFYEITAILINPTPDIVFISNFFFFISANIMGMIACYAIEFYARRDFFMKQQLEMERENIIKINEELKESEERYRELSIIDGLTQLFNSRCFYDQLKMELDRLERREYPLCLMLLDLDNFKKFNDTYGHIEGDHVLVKLGQIIKRCLRKEASAYRYGGEEFTILLPMTTKEEGVIVAERIREEVKKEMFSPALYKHVSLTVSIGLAQHKRQESLKEFVSRVDHLMYQSKNNGKDRVSFE